MDIKMSEYLDITGGLEVPLEAPEEINHREKRYIKDGLETMADYVNNLTTSLNIFEDLFGNTSKIMNSTALNIAKHNSIHVLMRKSGEIEARFDAIIGVQIQERLSTYLVSFDEFEVKKDEIEESLSDDVELPFGSLNEYYHNLKVSHGMSNRNLILTIEVPIVQKTKWNLYKIQEFPARFNDTLLMTNVGWKFFANSSNEFTTLTSLKSCTATGSSYLCEPQSYIHTTSNDSCLTHAFTAKLINLQMCKTTSTSYERLTFIQLSNAKFFYYAPAAENIFITCENITTIQQLKDSGIITLGSGCFVETPNYKLYPTQYRQSTPVDIVLNTGFERDELKKIIAGEKSYLTENPFYDNVLALHDEFYKPLTLEYIKPIEFAAWKDWHTYIVLALVLLAVVGIIIKCCCGRCC